MSKANVKHGLHGFHAVKGQDFRCDSWLTSDSKLLWIETHLKYPIEIFRGDTISVKIDKKFVQDLLNIGFSEKLIVRGQNI